MLASASEDASRLHTQTTDVVVKLPGASLATAAQSHANSGLLLHHHMDSRTIHPQLKYVRQAFRWVKLRILFTGAQAPEEQVQKPHLPPGMRPLRAPWLSTLCKVGNLPAAGTLRWRTQPPACQPRHSIFSQIVWRFFLFPLTY